jgi:NAD(P)H dehydrogenase (quinone)
MEGYKMIIGMTGATGNLGGLVAGELIRQLPVEEMVLSVRVPEKAKHWRELGVEVRKGDYDRPETLVKAFGGLRKLLLISSSHRDEEVRLTQHKAAIEAARQAGVRHLVYTSICDPEHGKLPLHRMHLETENAITGSGIPFTILRHAYYMDIIRFLGIREAAASGILLSPPGEWRFNTAAREDLASAAAQILTGGEEHIGRTYELTADKPWDMKDLAHAITSAVGRRVVHRTDSAVQSPLYAQLPLSNMSYVSPDLRRLVGRPLQSVREEVEKVFTDKR